MANIKIIDLPTGSPESTSFVEATQVDELAESGRSTVKLALNALGNFVAGQGASPLEYGNLETESTTLIGAANELHNTIGADAYDDTATYNTGDYCIYGGELYKCNDDNVTGTWDATKWDLTKVVDELGGGGGNADFVECTQAEYDAWEQGGTLDPDVMYFITDGQAGGSLVLPESIADEYDDTASYTAGDFVMYEGILYKCNHISATGSFDPTKWDAISAIDYINSVKSSLNTNISQLAGDLSDAYSSSRTYSVGDLCLLGNLLYKCNTAITTPEAWTPAHWTATTVKAELASKQNITDNSLNTTNKQIVPAINEVRDYDNLVDKPIYHDGLNQTTYKIPLPKRDSSSYYNGIMFFQTGPAATYGLFLVFVGTGVNPQIVISKLGGSSNTPTFTGSFADGILTLNASATIYGGITYIGF